MSDHERIWLEPKCCAEYGERTWCQDPDNWEHDTEWEPGHDTPTQYIRFDLYAELKAQIEAVKLCKRYSFDPLHNEPRLGAGGIWMRTDDVLAALQQGNDDE